MKRRHYFRRSANENIKVCVKCFRPWDDYNVHVPQLMPPDETPIEPVKTVVKAPVNNEPELYVSGSRKSSRKVRGRLGRGHYATPDMKLAAAHLFAQGRILNDVAKEIGISTTTAGMWRKEWREENGLA